MPRISAALALAALLPLVACEPGPTAKAPSTQAGIEADIMATRPASSAGLAPPISVTAPTPQSSP